MTHTPGPWTVIRKVGYTIYPEEDKSVYIAFMNEARDNSEANANLMATAPEMLKTLELVRDLHEGKGGNGYDPSEKEWQHCLDQIDTLIAKAKMEVVE